MATKEVSCPQCKKTAVFAPENPYRPFCSERCKLIDLGEWADGNYRVPATSLTPDELEINDMDEDHYVH